MLRGIQASVSPRFGGIALWLAGEYSKRDEEQAEKYRTHEGFAETRKGIADFSEGNALQEPARK